MFTPSLRAATVLVAAALFAGCTVTGGDYAPRVAHVSTITLERPLALPAGDARVYVQDGEIIRQQDRNRFEPWCTFSVRKRGADAELIDTIERGRFLAGEPLRWSPPESTPPGMRGVAVGLWPAGLPDGGTPGLYTWYTRYPLRSDGQPQVDTLTCGYDGDSLDGHLTLEEIRQTLGEIATVRTLD